MLTHFTNGCFCLFHAGHKHLLRQAARDATVLIVGLNSDASVTTLKGDRAVDDLHSREHNIRHFLHLLNVPFQIIIYPESTPERLIREIRPNALIKGSDAPRPLPGEDFVRSYGGEIRIIPRIPGISTTELLNRQHNTS